MDDNTEATDARSAPAASETRERSRISVGIGLVWKVMLVCAAICMPVAGVLIALDQKTMSDLIATAGFTLGVLAVPVGLLSLRGERDPESATVLELENTP